MVFGRKTTSQSRTHQSTLPAKAWIDLLSDPERLFRSSLNMRSVTKINETPTTTEWELVEVQPALLNLETTFTAFHTLLSGKSEEELKAIDPSLSPSDVSRIETRAALSTHTVSIWNITKSETAASNDEGGSVITERYSFDTPWITHWLVRRQVDETHDAAFAQYERSLQAQQGAPTV